MKRDPSFYREAAALLAGDFNRGLPVAGGWRLDVSDDLVLTVSLGDRTERAALSDEVEDPDWFDVGDTPEERTEMALSEAKETLADELIAVLDFWGLEGPRCQHDGGKLGVCTGVWFCAGHDVCLVGELTAADVADAPWTLAVNAGQRDPRGPATES